ncbi:MAG TPA: antibiotic biosynthesis monooxygenase [Pedobacter sp.]
MNNSKIILLVEIPVLPQFMEEVKTLSVTQLVPTLQEPGCEMLYQTVKTNDPNTLIFFEVFSSQATYDLHMGADYTKVFFSGLDGKLAGKPIVTHLQDF